MTVATHPPPRSELAWHNCGGDGRLGRQAHSGEHRPVLCERPLRWSWPPPSQQPFGFGSAWPPTQRPTRSRRGPRARYGPGATLSPSGTRRDLGVTSVLPAALGRVAPPMAIRFLSLVRRLEADSAGPHKGGYRSPLRQVIQGASVGLRQPIRSWRDLAAGAPPRSPPQAL